MSTRRAIQASSRLVICRRVPVEGTDAAGPADYSQVQPDRHHLRGMRPFAMQPVEGVDRVSGEIGGAAEPIGMEELHVVGVPAAIAGVSRKL